MIVLILTALAVALILAATALALLWTVLDVRHLDTKEGR